MKKYQERITDKRLESLERAMADGSVLTRFKVITAGDQFLKKMLKVYLSREPVLRRHDLERRLPIMKQNGVPEDLIWILACAASQKSIAQVLLNAIAEQDTRDHN